MPDLEAARTGLNGLVNTHNLPYTLVSTAEGDVKELRRRTAFVRRLAELEYVSVDDDNRKIVVAKTLLAIFRIRKDLDNLVGLLGGTRATVGDFAEDLRELAPRVSTAITAATQDVLNEIRADEGAGVMHQPYTRGEEAYLGKVLGGKFRPTAMCAVAAHASDDQDLTPLGVGNFWPDAADAWAAASVVSTPGASLQSALMPQALAARVQERDPDAVVVNVAQLDVKNQLHVARNLAPELERRPEDTTAAIMHSFC